MPVDIAINYDRCTDPLHCARCMRACPTMVFNARPPRAHKFTEADRHAFRLKATYYPSCIVCMACVELCPVDAISIAINGQQVTTSNITEIWPQGKPSLPTSTRNTPMGQLPPGNRRIRLENSGEPRDYDVPTAMIREATAKLNLVERATAAANRGPKESTEELVRLGAQAMALAIELGDGRYRDRTAEMIEIVAAQTGIHLPHRIQRYAELALISLRPQDRFNVSVATTKQLTIQVFTCAIATALAEAGFDSVPCEELCLSCFRVAARKVDETIDVRLVQKLPQARSCDFQFGK